MFITRADGVADMGTIDIGYHYSPHILFDLVIENEKDSYMDGDNLTLVFDLSTLSNKTRADVYFVMLDPKSRFFSAIDWSSGISPILDDFELPENTSISESKLLNIMIPSQNPRISDKGLYTFFLFAAKPGTADLISNLGKADLMLK